eukprot:gnl/TRDRNA2_/TRDRNA2_44525_c0_seq1.p1 gnl/TRDRNA2_/TRDRNA2_44525_c0~~gnl/TRDRNA2_/TRDRNA2_44525_c0_seq1.p1  ORF type:complete len:334 (+),score=49.75 gnl/TRDRNA2_/TRDRNA2_44525_c0_seq1:94-1095(+)
MGSPDKAAALALHTLPGVRANIGPLAEALVAGSALLVIGSVPLLPLGVLWLWRLARQADSENKGRAWTVFLVSFSAYMGLMMVPVKRRPQIMQGKFWRYWLEYLSIRIAYRAGEPLPPQQYVYIMMPHGLYPFSGAMACISKMVNIFANMRIAVAPIGLKIPLVRQLMGWIGCIGADRPTVSAALAKGESVCFFPGGIGEMMRTDGKSERLLLKSRKGFVKLALEHGVPIVPVYVFGQSVLWSQLQLPSWVEALSRIIRFSLMIPYGRWGTVVPRRLPLLYAIGKPILCPRMDNSVSQAQVESTHAEVVAAVCELYDFYKDQYGWANRPLIVE